MSQITKEDVLKKTSEIAELIGQQEEIEFFQQAEYKIKHNEKIQNLITEIKKKQQELVHAKHFKKSNYIKALEKQLDDLNHELNEIPLVKQYKQSLEDINRYMQLIIDLLKDQLSENIMIDK